LSIDGKIHLHLNSNNMDKGSLKLEDWINLPAPSLNMMEVNCVKAYLQKKMIQVGFCYP